MLLCYEFLILNDNRKIPMDCSKFHMAYEWGDSSSIVNASDVGTD